MRPSIGPRTQFEHGQLPLGSCMLCYMSLLCVTSRQGHPTAEQRGRLSSPVQGLDQLGCAAGPVSGLARSSNTDSCCLRAASSAVCH